MTVTSLWALTGGNGNADDGTPVTLGEKIRSHASTPLWAIGIRYYRGTLSAGVKTARLFRTSNNAPVSEIVTFADSGTGWQDAFFVTPVALDLNTLYTPGVYFPSGQPSFTGAYFTTGGPGQSGISSTPPYLFAPNNADAGGQGVYVANSGLTCPTNSFNSTCYWVDLLVTDVDPTPGEGDGTVGVTLAVGGDGTAHRGGLGLLAATLGVSGTGTAKREGTGTAGIGLVVTGDGTARRGGTAVIDLTVSATGAGAVPGTSIGRIRCGPPRTAWSAGPPLTSGGGVRAVMLYGSVQELQVPGIVHNGALVASGPPAWIAFGPAGAPLPDMPAWRAATWASAGVLQLDVDTVGFGLTRGKWSVFVKINDDAAVPYLYSGVLSIY